MGFTGGSGNATKFQMAGATGSLAPSVGADGDFFAFGNLSNSAGASESQRGFNMVRAGRATIMGIQMSSNAIDAAPAFSRFTLRVEIATPSPTLIIELDDSTPTGFVFVEGAISFVQGDRLVALFESDSVGNFGLRGISIGGIY